jgi:hypothetical protein
MRRYALAPINLFVPKKFEPAHPAQRECHGMDGIQKPVGETSARYEGELLAATVRGPSKIVKLITSVRA